jgi:hypothetical protein
MGSASDNVDSGRSILRDLRSGEAGCLPRLGISLAAAAAAIALAMLILALIDQLIGPSVRSYTSRGQVVSYQTSAIGDLHIVIVLLLASAAWFFALTRIWASYRRLRRLLTTIFAVLGIWTVTPLLCVIIDMTLRWGQDFLIGGIILSAIAATVLLITVKIYRHSAGRAIVTDTGDTNVDCPKCGYSMVGLHESRCPECGEQYTIDELIRRQDYDALRRKSRLAEAKTAVLDAVPVLRAASAAGGKDAWSSETPDRGRRADA